MHNVVYLIFAVTGSTDSVHRTVLCLIFVRLFQVYKYILPLFAHQPLLILK